MTIVYSNYILQQACIFTKTICTFLTTPLSCLLPHHTFAQLVALCGLYSKTGILSLKVLRFRLTSSFIMAS